MEIDPKKVIRQKYENRNNVTQYVVSDLYPSIVKKLLRIKYRKNLKKDTNKHNIK